MMQQNAQIGDELVITKIPDGRLVASIASGKTAPPHKNKSISSQKSVELTRITSIEGLQKCAVEIASKDVPSQQLSSTEKDGQKLIDNRNQVRSILSGKKRQLSENKCSQMKTLSHQSFTKKIKCPSKQSMEIHDPNEREHVQMQDGQHLADGQDKVSRHMKHNAAIRADKGLCQRSRCPPTKLMEQRQGPCGPSLLDVEGSGRMLAVEQHFQDKSIQHGEKRYSEWDIKIMERLIQYAQAKGGKPMAESCKKIRKSFVEGVLKGKSSSRARAPEEGAMLQAILEYVEMLNQLYPGLVLDPYIVNGMPDAAADLNFLRLASRRFIIYQPTHPDKQEKCQKGEWDAGLSALWDRICREFKGKRYSNLKPWNTKGPTEPSCNLMETTWSHGQVTKRHAPNSAAWSNTIEQAILGLWGKPLYLTDVVLPNHTESGVDKYAPGLSCAVNDSANEMLPEFLCSNRADSLQNFMKVESSGAATFTFFAPLGGGCNITAFHQETKRMRSFNCGCNDLIVQPLCTMDNIRLLERIHTTLFGNHKRHSFALPLEMYLEEGIPLVVYVRNKPFAEMVELPIMSCHTFLSYGSISSSVPAFKVSCNDFSLCREPLIIYLLEELARAEGTCKMMGGHGQQEADTWMDSSYFSTCPFEGGGQESPWKDEFYGAEAEKRISDESISRDMRTVMIRTAERLLDLVEEKLDVSKIHGSLPSLHTALDALCNLLPAVLDLYNVFKENRTGEGLAYIERIKQRIEVKVSNTSDLVNCLKCSPQERIRMISNIRGPATASPSNKICFLDWCIFALYAQVEGVRTGNHCMLKKANQLRQQHDLLLDFCCNMLVESFASRKQVDQHPAHNS